MVTKKKKEEDKRCSRCGSRLNPLEDAETGKSILWCPTCHLTANGKPVGN